MLVCSDHPLIDVMVFCEWRWDGEAGSGTKTQTQKKKGDAIHNAAALRSSALEFSTLSWRTRVAAIIFDITNMHIVYFFGQLAIDV